VITSVPHTEEPMVADLAFIVLTVAIFALFGLIVKAVERL
jgi:hypothetical protein